MLFEHYPCHVLVWNIAGWRWQRAGNMASAKLRSKVLINFIE